MWVKLYHSFLPPEGLNKLFPCGCICNIVIYAWDTGLRAFQWDGVWKCLSSACPWKSTISVLKAVHPRASEIEFSQLQFAEVQAQCCMHSISLFKTLRPFLSFLPLLRILPFSPLCGPTFFPPRSVHFSPLNSSQLHEYLILTKCSLHGYLSGYAHT